MELIQVKIKNGKVYWLTREMAEKLIRHGDAVRYVPSISERETRVPQKPEIR